MNRLLLTAAILLLGAGASAEETKITGYLVGTAPEGTQAVLDALNVKLKADLGARLEVSFIGWNELNSKHSLVLVGGEIGRAHV